MTSNGQAASKDEGTGPADRDAASAVLTKTVERFVVSRCAYDTEGKFLTVEGEIYPERPPRRLLLEFPNGRVERIENAFLPTKNNEILTGGVVNRFGGFSAFVRFLGEGALSSINMVAECLDGTKMERRVDPALITYDEAFGEIEEASLNLLQDRIEVSGWFRSYEDVSAVELSLGDEKIHLTPVLGEDRELSGKLGFRGPMLQRFSFVGKLSSSLSEDFSWTNIEDKALTAHLKVRDRVVASIATPKDRLSVVTARATLAMFDKRNSTLMVWGTCAKGMPPETLRFLVGKRQVGHDCPMFPKLVENDPYQTSWFVAEEINFELKSNHKTGIEVENHLGLSEQLIDTPQIVIVRSEQSVEFPDEKAMPSLYLEHNFSSDPIEEPVACFTFQGSINTVGGGVSRIKNMMRSFKLAGYSVVLVDRSAPWEFSENLSMYKPLWSFCDRHYMVPQMYKSPFLGKCVERLEAEVKSHPKPPEDKVNLLNYLRRTKKEGRLLAGNGKGLYARVDSHFNYSVAAIIDGLQPDTVISQFAWSCEVHTALPAKTFGLIDTHDVQSERYEKFKEAQEKFGAEVIGNIDGYAVDRDTEQLFLSKADACIAISPEERQVLIDMVGARSAVCAGISADHQEPMTSPEDGQTVLFIGKNYEANNYGIQHFVQKIWPQVLKACPKARLDVVGTCGDALRSVKAKNVKVHGSVPSIEEFYQRANVVINTVYFGTGVAVKTIEALARGKAVVSTPVGARGIANIQSSGAMIVGETDEELSAAVSNLLSDRAACLELEQAASRYAAKYLEPEVVFSELFNLLESKLYY